MSKIDMHMHSTISLDGEYRPKELARLCMEEGLEVVALSDHNSVRGVLEFQEESARYGIQVIPAIELDCTYEDLNLHLLGYGVDCSDPFFLENENHILEQMRDSSKKQMEIIFEAGILFDEAAVMKLAPDGIVVGEMIGEAAIHDVRNQENPLITPYLPGGSRSDNPYVNFYWDYFSQGKIAFLPIHYPTFYEAVDSIKKAGGFAVIAHPGQTVKKDEDRIRAMHASGACGMEVYSSYHTPEDVAYYRNLADELQMMKTMGSDFHGKTKPSVFLGKTYGEESEAELTQVLRSMKVIN